MEVFAEKLWSALHEQNPRTELLNPTPAIIGRPGITRLLRFFVRAACVLVAHASKYDVVLFGDAVLTPLARLVKWRTHGRIATVVAAHGNDVYYARRTSVAGHVYRTLLRLGLRSVDLLIANSEATRKVAKSIGFAHTSTVHLATEQQPAVSNPESSNRTILFAGRLMYCKGLAWFVNEVMPMIEPSITLTVAGPEWDSSELSAVLQCPRAHYLGTVKRDALPALRSHCLACVMPNLPAQLSGQNEGFGLSALEAPAVGVPVVAAKLGGLAEAVVDGVTGFLVEPMNARAFAERINTIAGWTAEQRARFATHARETIAERFTWDRVARDYLREFARLTHAPADSRPVA